MNYLTQLPSLNALKAFLAVAEQGSITAAAQSLNVTHGAISRQIKQLEDQLGMPLTSKHGRGIKLTDAGQQLYTDTSPALAAIAQSCQQLKQLNRDKPIVLACSGSILARWLIPRLHQLQQELPELALQLITSTGDDNPQQQGADASLLFTQSCVAQSASQFVLDHERIGPVVSPEFAKQHQLIDSSIERILDFAVLHTQSRPQAWPDWAAQQLGGQQLQLGQGFAHLYYLLEAITAGMGIGIAPQQLVDADIQQGRLIAPWGFVRTSATFCLNLHNPQQAQAIEQLAQWFSAHL